MTEFLNEDEDLLLPEEIEETEEVEETEETEEVEADPSPDAENEAGEEEVSEEGEEDEIIVSIGEEPVAVEDSAPAPVWVKKLRKDHKELLKENRELKAQVNAAKGVEQKPLPLGKKPTLEDCEDDIELFEQELDKWYVQKQKVSEQEQSEQDEAKKANQKWQATLTAYTTAKAKLEVRDFEEAEEVAASLLSVTQQGIILKGAKNPNW